MSIHLRTTDRNLWHTHGAHGFTPDGTRFVSGHSNERIQIWDVASASGTADTEKDRLQGVVSSISVSSSGRYIASADFGRHEVRVFDSLNDQLAFGPFKARFGFRVVFSPNNDMILASVSGYNVIVRNLANGNTVSLRGHADSITSITFSPNGRYLASGSYDKKIHVWDIESCRVALITLFVNSKVLSVAYSPDGKKIACASSNDFAAKINL